MSNRRELLKFIAASPLLAGDISLAQAVLQAETISDLGNALDVFDFEAAARKVVPAAHWGYMATGVDGDATLHANREGFKRYQLRTRRMVDVSHVDLSTELFGMRLPSPVVLCPVGSQKAFHPDGEVAVARAAATKGNLQILSTVSSSAIEEVIAARRGPIWYQLYATNNFDVTTKLVRRAEAAGCPVVAVTVDLPAGRNTVTAGRFRQQDTRDCSSCHPAGPGALSAKPMFAGVDTAGLGLNQPAMTWDFIARLRDVTNMKIVIKGLENGEDASLAVRNGADGIVVSNHGGRATETGRGTVESLPEVLAAVRGRIPVLVDGGFRRGTDIFKALALGATAVGIGRPYIWGLSAFGQQGVERVIDIVNEELRLAMVGCGTRSIAAITAAAIIDTRR